MTRSLHVLRESLTRCGSPPACVRARARAHRNQAASRRTASPSSLAVTAKRPSTGESSDVAPPPGWARSVELQVAVAGSELAIEAGIVDSTRMVRVVRSSAGSGGVNEAVRPGSGRCRSPSAALRFLTSAVSLRPPPRDRPRDLRRCRDCRHRLVRAAQGDPRSSRSRGGSRVKARSCCHRRVAAP
jgi:hypothetical protein